MRAPQSIFFLLFLSSFLAAPGQAQSVGSVVYSNQRVPLAGTFQNPMQCVLDTLRSHSYVPRRGGVGCFGFRPYNRSAHPGGYACDVDQSGRNLTPLNHHFSSSQQINLAVGCKAVSGCKWHGRKGPDCGHFEQRSAPYFRAGTPVALRHYYYGKKNPHFKKRS